MKSFFVGKIFDGNKEKEYGTFEGLWLVLGKVRGSGTKHYCQNIFTKRKETWHLHNKRAIVKKSKVNPKKMSLYSLLNAMGACGTQSARFDAIAKKHGPQEASKVALSEGRKGWYSRIIRLRPEFRIKRK